MEQQKLFRFHWDCGRNGDLYGVFVATQTEVDAAIGQKAYFGEVLGKHSDIQGTIDPGEIEVLTDDADFIEKAIKYGIASSGYNPLQYLNPDE